MNLRQLTVALLDTEIVIACLQSYLVLHILQCHRNRYNVMLRVMDWD
jgi:hypothetical protein